MEIWHDIEWVVSRGENYPLVWVSVCLIEEKWRQDVSDYIGAGGSGKAIENRYQRVGMRFREGSQMHAPVMCLDECGRPSFTDGRHRFAWVRDHKAEAIQVVVPPEELQRFAFLYGTVLRRSRWQCI